MNLKVFKVILRLRVYLIVQGDESTGLNKEISKKINTYCIIGMILVMCLFLKAIFGNKITTVQNYQDIMESFGIAGPIVLTFFQALQVVIPILPGYLGCAAGAISFGVLPAIFVYMISGQAPIAGFLGGAYALRALINEKSVFHIKNTSYSLKNLLGNECMANEFTGGTALIFRLTPSHYHRYVFCTSGIVERTKN